MAQSRRTTQGVRIVPLPAAFSPRREDGWGCHHRSRCMAVVGMMLVLRLISRLRPPLPGLSRGDDKLDDISIHTDHEPEVDIVVCSTRLRIVLLELDELSAQCVDGPDVNSIGAQHALAFLDLLDEHHRLDLLVIPIEAATERSAQKFQRASGTKLPLRFSAGCAIS